MDSALVQPVNTIVFEWDDLSFASGYKFEFADNPGFVQPETLSLNSSSRDKDTVNMDIGKKYFWRIAVSAPNVPEVYGPSHSFFYGSPLLRAAILAPVYGAIVPNPVRISWDYPGAALYYVQIATGSNFSQLVFDSWVNVDHGDIMLSADTTYYIRVIPGDANGNYLVGLWSYIYKFTTAP